MRAPRLPPMRAHDSSQLKSPQSFWCRKHLGKSFWQPCEAYEHLRALEAWDAPKKKTFQALKILVTKNLLRHNSYQVNFPLIRCLCPVSSQTNHSYWPIWGANPDDILIDWPSGPHKYFFVYLPLPAGQALVTGNRNRDILSIQPTPWWTFPFLPQTDWSRKPIHLLHKDLACYTSPQLRWIRSA